MTSPEPAPRYRLEPEGEEVWALSLEGRLDGAGVGAFWKTLFSRLDKEPRAKLRIQADGVTYCDGAGQALFLELMRRYPGEQMCVEALSPEVHRLLDLFDPEDFESPGSGSSSSGTNLAMELGREAKEMAGDLTQIVAFVGESLVATIQNLRHPRKIRWGDFWETLETAGVNGLPIIVLIGFLMGLIMSFQAAMPLKQFGAEIMVANLIALSMLRELGPLMTAIILAGRTGSAFAAEIGTMKVNEEIDALKTMGIQPVRFLVTTRILAAVTVTPLLTMFANLAGLVGGAIVLLSLGYPLVAYVRQALGAVDVVDLLGGLLKAGVFGLLVAGIGCMRGMQTSTGARAVGQSTTRAVVSGIVLIALADGFFSVLFYIMGI